MTQTRQFNECYRRLWWYSLAAVLWAFLPIIVWNYLIFAGWNPIELIMSVPDDDQSTMIFRIVGLAALLVFLAIPAYLGIKIGHCLDGVNWFKKPNSDKEEDIPSSK